MAVVLSPPIVPQAALSSIDDARLKAFRAALPQLAEMVSTQKIREHLLLVAAIMKMFRIATGPDASPEGEDLLSVSTPFVRRAIHRFEMWLDKVIEPCDGRTSIEQHELPPLDVVAIWHIFVLSPFRYFEDCLSQYPKLYASGPFPISQLAALVDPETRVYQASPEQKKSWVQLTGVPFDPFEHIKTEPAHCMSCPLCSSTKELILPWENNGAGFGEPNFNATCSECSATITNDTLCCVKFCIDLQNVLNSTNGIFSGTILNGRGEVDLPRARIISLEVIKALKDDESALPTARDATIPAIYEKLLKDSPKTRLRPDRMEAFLRPYINHTPFSVDFVEVVRILTQFNTRLENVGWLDQAFLSIPHIELDNARDRFYTFLEMVLSPEKGAVSASLDVDLVWHTMQLAGSLYREFTVRLLGTHVDHIPYEYEPEIFVASMGRMRERWKEVRNEDFVIPLITWKSSRTQKTVEGEKCPTCGRCPCTCKKKSQPLPKTSSLESGTDACGVSLSQVFLVDDTLDGYR
ncbi:hypothetical protein SCHPADRAFT_927722 [Schizopora paradoxa]|uniref:Uncharacterized protein n=1 Tax=Schizopora paradoxa TaxID=27342 RepID=A0A0H2RSU4_9AGAM|nr:hypothetical protein SCHPADRAFT_927722 [Schizopora paradoxa]